MFHTTFNSEKMQWNGPTIKKSQFNSNSSLASAILNALQVFGRNVAQICADTGTRTTFSELRALTVNAAKNLRRFGCRKGDVIFFLTKNTTDVPPLIFADLYLGCQVSSMPTCCSNTECKRFLNITKPKFVLCDLAFYPMFSELATENCVTFFTFDGQTDESRQVNVLFDNIDNDPLFEPAQIYNATDVAFIARSSGTTGLPKGVCISHGQILDNMRRMSSILGATDVVLGFTELYAISGIRLFMGATLNGSARIVNAGLFSSERFFDIVEQCKVTFTLTTAFIAIELMNSPQISTANLSSLKHYICAGNKVTHDVIETMNQYLRDGKFCHSYGMTEVVIPISINLDHTLNDCVGQLISGCEAKIVSECGQRLGIGECGELCLKLPYQFLGYLGDDNSASDYFDSEGFFMTGDIARFDANGDLYIVDRRKELFKSGGYQITPSEIEGFLNTMDGVKQSCLVPIPDLKCEFLPAAVVVKRSDSTCTEESIYNSVLNTFAHYKRLQGGVYFVDALPMTDTGKIARKLVTQMAIRLFNENIGPTAHTK